MEIRNEDIESVRVEIPEGHSHIRTTITLREGSSFTLQEAAMSNMVRAFIGLKTHPTRKLCILRASRPDPSALKKGYAEWQLMEEE